MKRAKPEEGIAYAIERANPESLESLREVLRRRCEETRKLWQESGLRDSGSLEQDADEVRLIVNIGATDAGE